VDGEVEDYSRVIAAADSVEPWRCARRLWRSRDMSRFVPGIYLGCPAEPETRNKRHSTALISDADDLVRLLTTRFPSPSFPFSEAGTTVPLTIVTHGRPSKPCNLPWYSSVYRRHEL